MTGSGLLDLNSKPSQTDSSGTEGSSDNLRIPMKTQHETLPLQRWGKWRQVGLG